MIILHVMECYRHDVLALTVTEDVATNAILLTEFFAGQALALVKGAAKERHPYHATLRRALESLHDEVEDSKLLLSLVSARMNEMLPEDMRIEPTQNKRLAGWLKEMGMTVTAGAKNRSYVSLP